VPHGTQGVEKTVGRATEVLQGVIAAFTPDFVLKILVALGERLRFPGDTHPPLVPFHHHPYHRRRVRAQGKSGNHPTPVLPRFNTQKVIDRLPRVGLRAYRFALTEAPQRDRPSVGLPSRSSDHPWLAIPILQFPQRPQSDQVQGIEIEGAGGGDGDPVLVLQHCPHFPDRSLELRENSTGGNGGRSHSWANPAPARTSISAARLAVFMAHLLTGAAPPPPGRCRRGSAAPATGTAWPWCLTGFIIHSSESPPPHSGATVIHHIRRRYSPPPAPQPGPCHGIFTLALRIRAPHQFAPPALFEIT